MNNCITLEILILELSVLFNNFTLFIIILLQPKVVGLDYSH